MKFATEVKSIEEQVKLKQIMSGSPYSSCLNDLLDQETKYNDKLIVEDGILKYISDKNSPHSTDVSEKAKDAIDWCSKYNILPPDIISDMDDQKILLCIGLYNTVKFLAEHI